MVEEIEEIMDDDPIYSKDPGTFRMLMAKVLCKLMCNEMDRVIKRDNLKYELFCIDVENNSYGGTKEPCVTLYRKTEEFKELKRDIGKAFGESTTLYKDLNTLVKRKRLCDIIESVNSVYYGNTYNTVELENGHYMMTDLAFKMNTILNDTAILNTHLDCISFMEHSTYGGFIDITYVQ